VWRNYVGSYISSNGLVRPCSGVPINVDSVKTKTLKEILSSDFIKMCREVEKHIKGHCRVCGYLERCYGCRSMAFSFTGDFLESDPLCWNNPNAFGLGDDAHV
jgi:radical SAM protein with 4Fe4S-binding SPASM domain